MSDSSVHTIGNLPSKPLVEAIFELRWAIETTGDGLHRDPGWGLLPGLYFGKVRNEYPYNVKLPAADLPEEVAAYSVRHQFRKAKDEWPLIQIGPGILTLNETTNYTVWEDFRPKIVAAVETLSSVYQGDLKPIRAELWFINAVDYDSQEWTPSRFLKERLHTTVAIATELFDGDPNPTNPDSLNLNFTIPLVDPPGNGLLAFATGLKNEKSCIIWHLKVTSDDPGIPSLNDQDSLASWLDSAHNVIDRWFVKLADGQLLENFRGAKK